MKKIIIATVASLATLSFAGDVAKLDVTKVCSVEKNGVEKVLAVAKEYNPVAVKHGVEFKRLGITNSAAIKAIEKALKEKKKEIVVVDKKKKKEQKFTVDYATVRACKFAVRALQQEIEGETNYKASIPGDGYKY